MFNLQNFFFRLSLKEKMLFARNLEVMINSGIQVLQSLEILKKQLKSKAFNRIVDQLMADVKNGRPLSTSLERWPLIFGDFFVNLVRIGESSGTLGDNLKYLAEELNKKQELKQKVRGAMIYPMVILGATLGITSLLTFFIFPKILPVLKSLNVALPPLTLAFISLSEFLLKYGLWVLAGLVLLLVTSLFLLRIKGIKFLWHGLILRLPPFNHMVETVNMISFSRTMGVLLKSGVKIVEALSITTGTLTNLVYKQELEKIAERVRQGEPISKYLNDRTRLFPPIFSQMVLVGENTGKLDESFTFLANFYESELDEAARSMSNVLEPVLLLVMGLIVSFVALAIITPIYKITQNLGR